MEKLNHAELLTFYSDVPFHKIDKAQPMLSQQDKLLYYYLAKNYYTGEGNIIDGGAFVGGTTICFSTGLMGNKNYTKDKKLIVYDLFRDSIDGFNSKYLQERFSQEDFVLAEDYIDFEKIFLKNIKFYEKYINIVVNKGNFLDYQTYNYQNQIEILSIDIAKNKDLMLHACNTFFPRLIAGKSLVILQDWITVPLPFIHIAMNLLNEYFDGYYECPNGSSKVFKCKKEITPEVINNIIGKKTQDYYNISKAKYIAMAIDHAVSIHNKATLEGALAMFYLQMGHRETARQHFIDTIVKYDLSPEFITNFPFSDIYQIFKDEIKYYPSVYCKFPNIKSSNNEKLEVSSSLEKQQNSIDTQEKFLGKLVRSEFISKADLKHISTYDLGCELLQRLQSESSDQLLSQNDVNLFSTLEKSLNQRLEIFENRFSLTWLTGQFYASYRYWQNHQIPIKDATYVEIGAGAINPFSFMFLYLMLGAKKVFCLEPDSLVNKPLILRNLAETVGKFIINQEKVIGDYPITKNEILANISSFQLDALLKGKEEGLDTEKLVYLQESLFNNSIPDNTADVLITVSVLEHLPDIDETLQEIARITKTGGYGLHNIDGFDHGHYYNSDIHPLEFLRVDTNEKIVGVCNRIRPMNFTEIFERNGFEVLEIRPYGKVEVSQELRNSFVEPFRSMTQEWLEVAQAYFLVRKK